MPALLNRKGWPAGIYGLVCWGAGLITVLTWLQD
jgi:hypothetical protein